MSTIFYNGPLGDYVENPNSEFIKAVVFNMKADYWAQGGGDSCIEIEGLDERLIFFYDEPYGFFIMRHPDYLVPYDGSVDIKVIEHRVGGEPMKIPTSCYVSRDKAFEVLDEFIEKKQIPKCIDWVDLYEINFDHGY